MDGRPCPSRSFPSILDRNQLVLKAVALSVGSRYAFSRRSSISFISLVAVLGLALSVGVLVVVISVVNGFDRELRERVFGMLPHLTLYGREPITATEDHADGHAADRWRNGYRRGLWS